MKANLFQTYICMTCGMGTVKPVGWGEDRDNFKYKVLKCDNPECEGEWWELIPYRDFPSDIDSGRLFFWDGSHMERE